MLKAVDTIPPVDVEEGSVVIPLSRGEADLMRRHLRTVSHRIDGLNLEQQLELVGYLERKALAGAPSWFEADQGLAWACEEYFVVADRLMMQLAERRDRCTLAMLASKQLASTCPSLIHHVLALGSVIGEDDSLPRPIVSTACGAAERFRAWCEPDEPGHDRMMLVVVYSLVGLLTRATCAMLRIPPQADDPGIDDVCRLLDESLETVESLLELHPEEHRWLDPIPARGQQGSRIVRAMRGIAGSCEIVAGLADPRAMTALERTMGLLERMWPSVFERTDELAGAIMALAHVVQAQAVSRAEGLVQNNRVSYRAAWLVRQAANRKASDPVIAHALMEFCATVACADGLAIQQGQGDPRLRKLAGELSIATVEAGAIRAEHALSALGNLSSLAAAVSEQGEEDGPQLMSLCARALTAL